MNVWARHLNVTKTINDVFNYRNCRKQFDFFSGAKILVWLNFTWSCIDSSMRKFVHNILLVLYFSVTNVKRQLTVSVYQRKICTTFSKVNSKRKFTIKEIALRRPNFSCSDRFQKLFSFSLVIEMCIVSNKYFFYIKCEYFISTLISSMIAVTHYTLVFLKYEG